MSNQPKYLWLLHKETKIEEGIKHPYAPSEDDLNKFSRLYILLFPDTPFNEKSMRKDADQYHQAIDSDPRYNISIYRPDPQFKIHMRLYQDISRTIGKFRNDIKVNDPYSTEKKHDAVMETLARILMFTDDNQIPYCQGFCDLLIPIYHIFFYGLCFASNCFPPSAEQLQFIEGVAAIGFLHFMTIEPFCHYRLFPNSQPNSLNCILEKMNALGQRLNTINLGAILQEHSINPMLFAGRWLMLAFTQDLPFNEVLVVWNFVINKLYIKKKRNETSSFHDQMLKICFNVAYLKQNSCKDKSQTQIIQILQNISDLSATKTNNNILHIPRKGNKKGSKY